MGLFLILALLASYAQAVPLPPALTATTPPSPGASLTPRIQGQAEGVITSAVPSRLSAASSGPVARASGEPGGGTVTIYANERNCLDPEAIAAEGTAVELEYAGIEVTVEPDSVTTFYASLSKEGEFSTCSPQGLTYRQVTTPPAPPTFSAVNPSSPANDNFPHLIGSAVAESVVFIYMTSDCSGPPIASGSAVTFAAAGIQVPVPDNSTTVFYATAALGGIPSTCSTSSIEYQEITPPPPTPEGSGPSGGSPGSPSGSSAPPAAPHLHMVPGGRSNDTTPVVAGSAPGAATVQVFENAGCGGAPVASGSPAQLASGLTVQVPENASTSFSAISVGAGGGRSSCSAPVTYVEDSTPPHTRITMAPGVKTRSRSPVLRFTDTTEDPPGTAFLCKVDHGRWKPCSAPLHLHRLHFSTYVVRVKGIDTAGNEEKGSAARRFKVIRRL